MFWISILRTKAPEEENRPFLGFPEPGNGDPNLTPRTENSPTRSLQRQTLDLMEGIACLLSGRQSTPLLLGGRLV